MKAGRPVRCRFDRLALIAVPFLPLAVVPWALAAGAKPTTSAGAEPTSAPLPRPAALACPVTLPTTSVPPGVPPPPEPSYYGNGALWTAPWPQGRIVFEPGGPGFVLPDGSLGMKWPWIPFVPGDLTVTGHRLDEAAPPLRSEHDGLATTQDGQQFFPTYLIFPTPGCWQVTGRVGAASLTFVALVVKVGGGPDWRPSSVP